MGVVLMRGPALETTAGTCSTTTRLEPGRARTEADAPRTTLFCIPHAGGSAGYYMQMKPFLPSHVAFQPLELAGRGRRCREPLATSMDAIARDLFGHVAPVARTAPYALFGHSMGALLALLCAVHARTAGLPLPQALFVSASAPPDAMWRGSSAPLPSQSSAEVWASVESLGGIPAGVANSPEFRRYLEPILHADVTAMTTWRPGPLPPLPVPITVFLGDQDVMDEHVAQKWRPYTTDSFDLHVLRGNHFYLQDHWETLATRIASTLASPKHAGNRCLPG